MSQNFFRKVVPMCCSLMLVLAACGGGSSSLSPDADLGVLSPIEDSMMGKMFNNQLIVYVSDDEAIFSTDSSSQKSLSTAAAGKPVEHLLGMLKTFPSASLSSRAYPNEDLNTLSVAKVSSLRALQKERGALNERLSGQEVKIYEDSFRIKVKDGSDAVRIYRQLKVNPYVTKIYPIFKKLPSGNVGNDMMQNVPELVPYQGYLHGMNENGNVVGGLNVISAKASFPVAGSSAVWVVSNDGGVDFDHPDLSLSYTAMADGGNRFSDLYSCSPQRITDFQDQSQLVAWQNDNCATWASHGTAVMGVLAGVDDDSGVQGILPTGVRVLLAPTIQQDLDPLLYSFINSAVDLGQPDLLPGSIFLLEDNAFGLVSRAQQELCAYAHAHPEEFANGEQGNPCSGTLPNDADPDVYRAIHAAQQNGITIIAAAANGGTDLDDPASYPDGASNFLYQNGPASILVGESQGPSLQKHPLSNCGSQVELFAWGENVVTTNYADHFSPENQELAIFWDPSLVDAQFSPQASALLEQYYATNFGGTSSAAAIIAGVAGLMQNYVKAETGRVAAYLMPEKIREILIASGTPQVGNDCNIGVQPDAERALQLTQQFVQSVAQRYPEYSNRHALSSEDMRLLRADGLGLICETRVAMPPTADQLGLVINPDPSCSEEVVHPKGSKIAKDLDFDGDNRAELVKWTRDGGWQVDLSSVGGGEFGFGAWNITVNNPAGLGEWVSPYAIDLDSDGRTDFVLYDRENNVWNVLYTRWSILQGSQGQWREFQYDTNDWVDDRKLDWKHSNYSRPVPGDYNGDGWVDIAIACSDGIWRIDYSDEGEFDGDFEDENERITFLDEAKLEAAPGWAWLPFIDLGKPAYRTPDALADAGDLYRYDFLRDEWRQIGLFQSSGNNQVLEVGEFDSDGSRDLSFKNADGSWQAQSVLANQADELYLADLELPQSEIFGGSECHPTAADFDGDSLTDRAVLCPDGWTVAYSAQQGDEYISRRYTGNGMGYDADEFTVPGRVYFGGISYAKSVQLINFALQANPRQAPPIPVDMVTPFVGGD